METTALVGGRFSVSGVWDRVVLAWNQSLSAVLPWLSFFFPPFVQTGLFFMLRHYILLFFASYYFFPGFTFWVLDWFFWLVTRRRFSSPVTPVVTSGWWSCPLWVICLLMYSVTLTIAVVALIVKPRRVLRVCDHGFVVEKAVKGSEPVVTPPPAYIGLVYTMVDGVKRRQGVFFRVGNFLYTAAHVVLGADKVWFSYGKQELEVKVNSMELDTDLIRYPYEPFSTFQMGAGKLAKTSHPMYCQVHNGSVATFGKVTVSDVVGYAEFSGTTLPGFSGAPYYIGNVVYGMHLGAGVVNLGYTGEHLNALISAYQGEAKALGGTDPALEEELLCAKREGREIHFRPTPNDFLVAVVGGKERCFTSDEVDYAVSRVNYKFNKKQGGKSYRNEKFSFQDSENFEGLAVPVYRSAGPLLRNPVAPAPIQRSPSLDSIASDQSQEQTPTNTNGQERTLAQQNEASAGISEELQQALSVMERIGLSPAQIDKLRNKAQSLEQARVRPTLSPDQIASRLASVGLTRSQVLKASKSRRVEATNV